MPKAETSLSELFFDIRRIEQNRAILTEQKIDKLYKSLMKDLNSFIAEEYVKYADEEGRLYTSYLDAKNQRARFLQEMSKNVESFSPELQKEIETLIDTTYEKTYKGMVTALKKADTAGKLATVAKDIAVNPNVLKRAINNNISKLTLPAVMNKHRNEIIYQIQQELNIGLMQGDRYETMAKRVQTVLEGNGLTKGAKGKSKNIVRTESHRNIEGGFMDCAEEIQKGLDGSDLIYAATWRTMKDERVRPQRRTKTKHGWKFSMGGGANHMKMEGKTVKAGEFFDLGDGNQTKAPSESGVAAHDCNCRCFLEYNLMTPEEFAKATGKKVEKVKATQTTNYTPAKSISEAEQYAGKFAKDVSYRGATSLDDVNTVNETLEELTTKYPVNELKYVKTNGRLTRAEARANYNELEIQTKFLNGVHEPYDWASRIERNKTKIAEYETYIGNPRYNQKAVEKAIKQMQEEAKYTRWSVGDGDVRATITHEYGHILADQYIGQINGARANPNFGYGRDNPLSKACSKVRATYTKAKKQGDIFNISMYANTDEWEFFAETFTMYVKGEKLPTYITDMLEEVLNGGIL